jgi:hypothetical protein
MTSELDELLDTVAREVTVEVKHAPELDVEPLSPVAGGIGGPGMVDEDRATFEGDALAADALDHDASELQAVLGRGSPAS